MQRLGLVYLVWYVWFGKFGLITLGLSPKYTFGSFDLVWYTGFGNWILVAVRLYHLSKPKTSFDFDT